MVYRLVIGFYQYADSGFAYRGFIFATIENRKKRYDKEIAHETDSKLGQSDDCPR